MFLSILLLIVELGEDGSTPGISFRIPTILPL
jgi:hypothetical protein